MRLIFVPLRLEPSNRRGWAARSIQFPSIKSRIIFFWQTIQFRNSSGLDCLFFTSVFRRRASFLNDSNAPPAWRPAVRAGIPAFSSLCSRHCASLGIRFCTGSRSCYSWLSRQISACSRGPAVSDTCRCIIHSAGSGQEKPCRRLCTCRSSAPTRKAGSCSRSAADKTNDRRRHIRSCSSGQDTRDQAAAPLPVFCPTFFGSDQSG